MTATPLTVMDIGARGGFHPRWISLGSQVQIIGIDADATECARMNAQPSQIRGRYVPAALGAEDDASATLYCTAQPGCSSLLQPNHAYLDQFVYGRTAFKVLATVPVTLARLDTVCGREGLAPDVIKIDTQGSELDILRGGEQALRTVSLIELEVEFNPLYVHQPLFGECDSYLRARGFSLLGLRRTAWRRDQVGAQGGTIVHGDAVWIREPVEADARRRFALALLAYRQYDYARSLGTAVNGLESRSRMQQLVGSVLAKLGAHRDWRGWLDRCRGSAVDWHDPDFF